MVYDVTDAESFENVKNWMHEIEKFANESVCILIVGNKCDVEGKRKVSKEQGEELAKHYKVPFIEASAKTGTNVDETFMLISREVHNKQQALAKKGKPSTKPGDTKVLTISLDAKKDPCCT